MTKTALITGVRGQDGSYLAELLLDKGYEIHGLAKRRSDGSHGALPTDVLSHPKFQIHDGDVTDAAYMTRLVKTAKPAELFNLACMSHVHMSFAAPEESVRSILLGTLNCLEAIRNSGFHTRMYQASSSEMYGGARKDPYNEDSQFNPRSPYAVAKTASHHLVRNYRESYLMYACSGILFNHEGARRGPAFVTRKIILGVRDILVALRDGKEPPKLRLGNLDAARDWGLASDYVYGMWLMLQQPQPQDYVLATGEAHTVREFCQEAFTLAGLNYQDWIQIDPSLYRPSEVHTLLGDSTKARKELGWEPKTKFKQLVQLMLEADCRDLLRDGPPGPAETSLSKPLS